MIGSFFVIKKCFILPCVCSVTDHRRRQNVVQTSSTQARVELFCSYHIFRVFCDRLPHRSTTTWYLFVQQMLQTKDADYRNSTKEKKKKIIKRTAMLTVKSLGLIGLPRKLLYEKVCPKNQDLRSKP